MGLSETLLLGFIAGATILLGLPLGRLPHPAARLRGILNGAAVGILLFLVWDVLSAAWEPIDAALTQIHDDQTGLAAVLGYGALFVTGLTVGLLGLVGYEQWMRRSLQGAGRREPKFGPGAMATRELDTRRRSLGTRLARWSPARRLALQIAVGIGLHNFAEGLAIGQSAASGEIALATLLVIGFGLHNATEGFGIVAPLAGDTTGSGVQVRPSWPFLLALGAIGGGPTFLGTIVGHAYTAEPVAVAFLSLAAGSIIYVIVQLIGVATKARRSDLLAYGLLLGLVAGFATDAIIAAAGA
jgi:ZIP family zinc transporter